MKRRILISLMLFVSIIALTSAHVYAAAAANTFKFTETYVQKVGLTGWGYYEVRDAGKFTITAKVSLAGVDITRIDGDTPFYIYVGNFYYSGVLEDAIGNGGKLDLKKKTAKIIVKSDPEWDEYRRTYPYLEVQLKWSATQLQITVKGTTPTYEVPIWSDYYIYESTRTISEPDPIDANIEFGDSVNVLFDVYLKGKVTTKIVRKKGEEFDVSNIKLTGTGILASY